MAIVIILGFNNVLEVVLMCMYVKGPNYST